MSKEIEFKNYYELLGVSPSASKQDIKAAYRKLIRKWHPDVSKDPNANRMTIELNEAYDLLTDDAQRLRYNRIYMDIFGKEASVVYDFSRNTIKFASSTHDNLAEARRRAEEEMRRAMMESEGNPSYGDIVWERERERFREDASPVETFLFYAKYLALGNCTLYTKPDFIELNIIGLKLLPMFIFSYLLSILGVGLVSLAFIFFFVKLTHVGKEKHFIGIVSTLVGILFAAVEFSLIILIANILLS